MINKNKKIVPVLVVDFGSQTTQLILRRIREIGIYCEVISYHQIIDKIKIRRLTPIECERLQTLPDNYTEGVSDTQRYKALGNGWTVDVAAHIFKHI